GQAGAFCLTGSPLPQTCVCSIESRNLERPCNLSDYQLEAIIAKELLTLSADARAILESMGDAFYALDADWRFVYANRRAPAVLGATAESVIGQVIWRRFPSMVGTLNERVLRRVRDEQRVVTFEAESPTTGVWVSVNVGPSGDGVAIYWRDITERVDAEQ